MDEQVGDHHHVDQRQHAQHDLRLGQGGHVMEQMPELQHEAIDVDALGDDEAEIERRLEPAAEEDEAAKGLLARQL